MRRPALLLLILGTLLTVSAVEPVPQTARDTQPPPGTLTGNWSVRTNLASRGVEPFVILTSEVWGNVSGGLKQGAWYNQLLDFGVSLDTTRLGWWSGGTFFGEMHWVEHSGGRSYFDDYTGAFNPVSSILAGDQIRVFNLYYRQSWRDDTVVLKLGQIAVDDDFMKSDYAALFLNSAFGAMPSQVGTPLATSLGNLTPFPIYSVAAPGLFVEVGPFADFYSQLGIYYGEPGPDEPSNHGFAWINQTPPELGLFWESGLHYPIASCPATSRFGLSYHTGPHDDFHQIYTVDPPATRQNVPKFYLIQDVQLLSDALGNPRLGAFCRGGIAPDADLSLVAAYVDAGLNWFAPIPGRPHDVAGIGTSYTQFGNAFQHSITSDGIAASETTLELTYKAQITQWFTLQADAQILFNPLANPATNSRQTAFVIGLRAEIGF